MTFTVLSGSTPSPGHQRPDLRQRRRQHVLPAARRPRGGHVHDQGRLRRRADFKTSTDNAQTLMVNPAAGTTTAAANANGHVQHLRPYGDAPPRSTARPARWRGQRDIHGPERHRSSARPPRATSPAAPSASTTRSPPTRRSGTYTIKAVYSGTLEFSSAIDKAHKLTINAAAPDVSIGAITVNSSASTGDGTAPAKRVPRQLPS